MQKEPEVDLSTFIYDLPTDKIAFEGTSQRDKSKLLCYKNGNIQDHVFNEITELLPSNSTLFFNNTKVIPARLFLQKKTGAIIEIFLLKPAYQKEISLALETSKPIVWECIIGNLKKWKNSEILTALININQQPIKLEVKLIERASKLVEFKWNSNQVYFSQLIDVLGNTPLPPYIKRDLKEDDKLRYQTVYSAIDGAVAAPTAGLHFTTKILAQIKSKGIAQNHLTLHVGAGTFMPIKAKSVQEHPMHNEKMIISVESIESVLKSAFIISVGTTSMRTLESLFWFGVKLLENPEATFKIDKLYPYIKRATIPSKGDAFKAILNYASRKKLTTLYGDTEIFIFPGYKFRVCEGLITNFHQPESTLILLVAAFVGNNWKSIYDHALQNNYRFLSFGDSSLLLPN